MISSIFLVMAMQQSPSHHVVVTGDTLSEIASSTGVSWPQLYADNRAVIGGNPNFIYPGEVLHTGGSARSAAVHPPGRQLTAATVTAPLKTTPAPASGKTWGVSYGDPNYCGDGDDDGWDVPCQTAPAAQSAPVQHPAPAPSSGFRAVTVSSGRVSTAGLSAYQACVITRESGGNPNIWNASGHWGLYQFSESTWIAAGGSAASFGHASVAEQNQMFASAYAQWGTQPWSPSDGC